MQKNLADRVGAGQSLREWLEKGAVEHVYQISREGAQAGVKGKTPHSARHAMGRHLAQKFGNVEAVQQRIAI